MSNAFTPDQALPSLTGPWRTLYRRPIPDVLSVDGAVEQLRARHRSSQLAECDGSFFTGVAVALPISLLLIVALIALVRWVVR